MQGSDARLQFCWSCGYMSAEMKVVGKLVLLVNTQWGSKRCWMRDTGIQMCDTTSEDGEGGGGGKRRAHKLALSLPQ